MGVKVTNNAYGTLAAGISSAATTINLNAGQGARFPALAAGEWAWATLSNAADVKEIVKITARAGDTLTVQRGMDNTTASAYLVGDRIDMRPCAAAMNDKMDVDAANTALAAKLDTTTAASTYRTEAQVNTALVPYVKKDGTTDLTGPLKLPSGTAAAPSVTFSGDTDTGLFRSGDGVVSVVSNGLYVANMSSAEFEPTVQVRVPNGTSSAPSYSFTSDTNTGIYRSSEGTLSIVCNGTVVATFGPTGLTVIKVTQTNP